MDGTLSRENGANFPVDDPWSNPARASQEIKSRFIPVDYKRIVGENRIVFLGEGHFNPPVREHIARYARQMKEAGVTHYAIEAAETIKEIITRLNNGESVDLSNVLVGPVRSNYEVALRAMVAEGIQIVPIDVDQSKKPTREEREAHITDELVAITASNPEAKVAVLIGGFHTAKSVSSEGVAYTGKRIADAGIPAVTVMYAGGSEKIPKMVTESANLAGMSQTEFMMDLRPYVGSKYVPYGAGQADYLIHLPQQI